MDLARLRTLRELSLRTTMAAVADAMHISPSAVSQQITQLEDELEIALVERRGRGVRLTPAGKRLVTHIEKLVAVLEEAKTDIARMRSVVAGELRIAAFPSVAARIIPPAMRALEQKYPHLYVVFEELEPVEGWGALRSWQVDVAIVDDLALSDIPTNAGIETESLMVDELLVMLPTTHRLARSKSIALEDLKDDHWALDTSGTYSQAIIDACERVGFRPMITGNCSGFSAVAAMVGEGCAVSVMPGLRVRRNLGRFAVARIKPPMMRKVLVAYRRGAQQNPAVAALLTEIRQAVAHAG